MSDSAHVSMSLPLHWDAPVIWTVPYRQIRFALVNRDSFQTLRNDAVLKEDWKTPGAYILIGPVDGSIDKKHVYVGKATSKSGLLNRVNTQMGAKPFWNQALLIANDPKFNDGEAAWLEEKMHSLLHASPATTVDNQTGMGNGNLSDVQQHQLSQVVPIICGALRLLGVSPDVPNETKKPPSSLQTTNLAKRTYSMDLPKLIETGYLSVGTKLVCALPTTST